MNTEKISNSSRAREWLIFLLLALLVLLLRLPSLEQPFDNDSSANAYHARLIIQGEPLYGSHHPAHHLPGIYYTNAFAFLLFGDTVWAVKFFLLLWIIAATYLIYRLGSLMMDRLAGILGALFFAVLTSHLWLWGTTAETELFANLPRIAAVLLLMYLVSKQAAPWHFVWVGLLAAVAFLFKAVYLSPLVLTAFVLLVELWWHREGISNWQSAFVRGAWTGAGFLFGVLPVLLYFWAIDLLPRLWLVFSLGREYVQFRNADPETLLLWPFYGIIALGKNNLALLVYSFSGFAFILLTTYRQSRSATQRQNLLPFYIAVWYFLSFVEAQVTRVFFYHYYLLIVPALALLAAWFVAKLCDDVYRSEQQGRWLVPLIVSCLLLPALFISAGQNLNYYNQYVQYKTGRITRTDFIRDSWPGVGSQLVMVQELADYIAKQTAPDEQIYYWSGGVQLYYLANRRSSLDVIWPLYAEATGPYQRIFSQKTKYLILGESNNMPRPEWLEAGLIDDYALETIIHGQEVYRRVDYSQSQ